MWRCCWWGEQYEQLDRVSRGDDVLSSVDRLEALAFDVFNRANPRIAAANDLAAAFQAGMDDADRMVVALTGHFVTDSVRTWMLTADATEPDLFTVDDVGLSVDSVLRLLSARPGEAVLVLGTGDPDDLEKDGSALRAGIGDLTTPQVVTVIQAQLSVAASTLSGPLTAPEAVVGRRISARCLRRASP